MRAPMSVRSARAGVSAIAALVPARMSARPKPALACGDAIAAGIITTAIAPDTGAPDLKLAFSEDKERLALAADLPYHRQRTGGRVVDGTALEMRRACKGSVGSNPTLSAIKKG